MTLVRLQELRQLRRFAGAATATWCLLAAAPPGLAAQGAGTVPDLSRWERRLVHEAWTMEDGLPVNSITALLQSRDGYIWAGTYDGLVRFDGVRFTVFNSSVDENLPSNRILGLLEARDGTLWLTTERHVVRFRHNRFDNIGPDAGVAGAVRRLFEDRSGRIWVTTTRVLGRIEGNRFVTIVPAPRGALVSTVIERRDGSIWLGTSGSGLFVLDERAGSADVRPVPGASLDSAMVRTLFEEPSGRLWIGTSDGVWVEANGFARVPADVPLVEVVQFVPSPKRDALFAYAESGIYRVDETRARAIDSRRRIVWPSRPITVDTAGVPWHVTGSELGRDGRTVLSLGTDSRDRPAVTEITAMAVDHEGSIWIGTRAAGLHRAKPSFITTLSESEGIGYRNTYPIHQDRAGDIWVGTFGNGLSRIHTDGRISAYTRARGYPASIHTLYADRSDRLWVGAGTGLFACSLPQMACVRDDSPPPDAVPYALFEDSGGRLWGGFSTGLLYLQNGEWVAVPHWPRTGTVRAIAETPDGAIWVGTNGGGLVRYRDGRIVRVTAAGEGLPIDVVRALHVDAHGWLWVGTEGRGLARLDPLAWSEGSGRTDRRIVSIRAAHGLFDEVIHRILEDDAGRVWMSTNRGIFWVDREALVAFADGRVDRVRSTGYTERDGLRSREANGGVQPAGIRARDGRLWFPTQDGVAIVDPADVGARSVPPPVIVEGVVAGDSATVPDGARLEFGVDQRDLQIDYTALSFLQPANVRFRYRLDPYDADWVEAGPRRTAFYTRVPPGRYTFRVAASNEPGSWAGEETAVEFRLVPRFRETRGALVLGLVGFGLVVAAGYRRRVGNLRRSERELARLVEVRTTDLRHREKQLEERNAQLAAQAGTLTELNEARSRLFANLSHELRTPLTLILGPLRGLIDGRHGVMGASVRDQHDLMLRNGERLLALINQILDMASLQAGALSLRPRRADLVECVQGTTLAFAPLAERRGLELRFRALVPELSCVFDPEHLEKVLLNLLSNAVKFTESGGTVEVEVRAEGDSAEIRVRDSGIGIAAEELPRIFDRFYQADSSSTRRYEGTGIGLALAKELVGLHGGDIRAASTPGAGSTFTVRLPISATTIGIGNAAAPTVAAPARRSNTAPATPLPAADAMPGSALAEDDAANDRPTVLIVDDNADVRAYVRSILGDAYSVIEAGDGQEGLEAARAALPDLIVADVMMPRLDGLALGRALKDDPMTDAIPLVLLTARAAPADHVAGFETGTDAYLVKPFHPDVLEACAANLLAQRRRLRERFRLGESALPTTVPEPAVLDQRLRPLVESNLTDPNFGPDELAAAAALSYHQLYRALRDELGVTPSGFIRRVRVDCAAVLLRQRAGSVTEIAYSVGFESLSYFRRAFHERFQAAPTAYLATAQRTPTP